MEMNPREEQSLVEALLNGEQGAATRFYHAYRRRIWAFVQSRVQTNEDAEEIVQDVFLSALDSLALYSGRSKLFSWLCGIAVHEISDYYRKKQIKTLVLSNFPILESVLSDSNSVEERYADEEIRLQIELVLGRLLPRYAQLLRMKYLEGWPVSEIAVELDESLKAVETALFRARKAFAIEWQLVNTELNNNE